MPRTSPPYPPEFRREAIQLARSAPEERPISRIARELVISAETLRNRVKQDEIDAGEREGLTTKEREELRWLRRENKILKQEKEILRPRQLSSEHRTLHGGPAGDRLRFHVPALPRPLEPKLCGLYRH